jgi:hypothetical protein
MRRSTAMVWGGGVIMGRLAVRPTRAPCVTWMTVRSLKVHAVISSLHDRETMAENPRPKSTDATRTR